MTFRVCIPTAGTGSRLGELTRYLNKSLVAIANRPTLAHLLEQFPRDAEFVIALGHKGALVREFLTLAYPDRQFLFVEVKPFEGPGSGLGRSLLACRDHLQTPFVFLSCDTLVDEPIPAPDRNWMGLTDVADAHAYRTATVEGDRIAAIWEKGDAPEGAAAYIGLAGVHDHAAFWDAMASGGSTAIETGEAHGLRALVDRGVAAQRFTWHDTGNPEALARARTAYRETDAPNILEKGNEAIWFVDDSVIKFSDDTRFIANRVRRVEQLSGFVPTVTASTPHMYRYAKAPGRVLSEIINRPLFDRFLKHCKRFWQPAELSADQKATFREGCRKFYRDKTYERVDLFYKNFGRRDGHERINGEPMPTLRALFEKVDWDWLCNGTPGRFHGDFHFENILWDEAHQRFTFLDWRQDFAGDLTIGDVYYDLAKLLHGLIVNHGLIARDLYNVQWADDRIDFDLNRKQTLVACERTFESWLGPAGYDLRKVRILTALVYLNIAALHHHPYSLLLYGLGKSMLADNLPGHATD